MTEQIDGRDLSAAKSNCDFSIRVSIRGRSNDVRAYLPLITTKKMRFQAKNRPASMILNFS